MEFWSLLFLAVGTAMFLEGLPWFVAPRAARRTIEKLVLLGDGSLRGLGLTLMTVGLIVAWLSSR